MMPQILNSLSIPPEQTVCDGDESQSTVTLYYQGPPQTDHEVHYVTYNTWVTVWVAYVLPNIWIANRKPEPLN